MQERLGFLTVPVRETDPACGFSCGEPELDEFLAKRALPNAQRGFGNTFVLPRTPEDDPALPDVLGYYTLASAQIDRTIFAKVIPHRQRHGLPKYPLPAALIGRLGVDTRAQRRGLGDLLIGDACRRAVTMAEHGGGVGILVDAKGAVAESFYKKHGFVTLDSAAAYPRRMFLPMSTARSASTSPVE